MLPPNRYYSTAADALFLDFDGTLVDLAPQPESVVLPVGLMTILQRLQSAAGGALAIVSGRPLEQIDSFLAPMVLAAAGVHGAERRRADGSVVRQPAPDTGFLLAHLSPFVNAHPGLRLEIKRGAVALHYRHAPQLEQLCIQVMSSALMGLDGVKLLHGKMVVEATSADVSKGDAVAAFMREPPFAGRRPVYVGDDITDESAFSWAQSATAGGIGIKVGEGHSQARLRLADPDALRNMLLEALGAVSN
ncbi:trehalose-phosphatase [Collimonas arenae]|uniref:Trehalose 6-phosphate phosphatase n=1 Tax=Collimonas arenae TaxID=279058 RepID=A0A127QK47_9BURK|nr:trehalose-phosphatase [Collimonas arenae]AMP00546.1 trehalose-phosphatase [Collimonas arenae]AMP10427.1 trehalose-phosphatase [Collimonas arenae]